MPSSRPRWTAHTSWRCSSSRSRNGHSRNVISTVLALRRRNRGSNPASASASCSTARFGPRGAPAPGLLHAAAHQVGAPFPREFLRALALACTGQQPRQDVGQQPVVAAFTALAIHGGEDRLGPSHRGGSPLDLARHQAGILETPQVRAHRVGVQGQADGELAHGHRPAGQAQVPVEPVARVVGERLVHLDRCGFGHLVSRRRLDFHGQHRVKRADTILGPATPGSRRKEPPRDHAGSGPTSPPPGARSRDRPADRGHRHAAGHRDRGRDRARARPAHDRGVSAEGSHHAGRHGCRPAPRGGRSGRCPSHPDGPGPA